MKIFVTVGASYYQFNRLLENLDEISMQYSSIEIFAQIGNSKYIPKKYQFVDYITAEKIYDNYESADLIISHGGTGSVLKALKMNKKLIIFPRLSMFDEHLNDHQLKLARYCSINDYAMVATNKIELANAIVGIESKKFKEFKSNTKEFNTKLYDLIDTLVNKG